MKILSGLPVAVLLAAMLGSCSGGGDSSPALVSISVAPVNPNITLGTTQQFSATGTYSDNSTKDLTTSATWTSSDTAIATVDSAGLVTPVAAGSTTITAVSGSVSGIASLTIRDAALESPFGFLDVPPDKFTYYSDLNTHWLRGGQEGFDWGGVEKVQGVYDFSSRDGGLCNLYTNGQNLIYAIRPINALYGTYWVEGKLDFTDEYPDNHVADYGNFIKAWVERYDGDGVNDAPCSTPIRIKNYQFVHELGDVTHDYWRNHPDQYAEIFETIYSSMKAACSDCVLYMPVPILEDMIPEQNYFATVLGYLQGKGITDIGFDYHTWSMTNPPSYVTKGEDYVRNGDYIAKIKSIVGRAGFNGSNIISAESGMAGTLDMERDQAGYVVRMYLYSLSKGQKKVFWTTTSEYSHYADNVIFAHTGLIHNPLNADGLSHKKLAYYAYKKMAELIEGSDWGGMQTIQESNDVKVYKLMKNGRPVYVAWWDYYDNPLYIPGSTKQAIIYGITGSAVKLTEAVPLGNSGLDVADYTTAFHTEELAVSNGSVTLRLGENPVFVEVLQ
jgi:hypothetical protein